MVHVSGLGLGLGLGFESHVFKASKCVNYFETLKGLRGSWYGMAYKPSNVRIT